MGTRGRSDRGRVLLGHSTSVLGSCHGFSEFDGTELLAQVGHGLVPIVELLVQLADSFTLEHNFLVFKLFIPVPHLNRNLLLQLLNSRRDLLLQTLRVRILLS